MPMGQYSPPEMLPIVEVGEAKWAPAMARRGSSFLLCLVNILLFFVLYHGLMTVCAGVETNTNEVSGGPLPPTHARVIIAQNPESISAYIPRLEPIRSMVTSGLTNLTGQSSVREAWRSLVSTQDTIGIKVHSGPGGTSGTRSVVVEAVILNLLELGLKPDQIIVWDKYLASLRIAGYERLVEMYKIRLAGSMDAGFDTNQFYETPLLGNLVYGDQDYGSKLEGTGRKSYVSKLVTREMTKIISIAPLLNHNVASVAGHLFGLSLGSVDNTLRFSNEPDRMASAVPEIYALPVLGDRVVLCITDALVAQYYGEERSLLHYSGVLGQLRFSTDPVALDVLSIQELARQRQLAREVVIKPNLQLYLNASMVEIGVSDPARITVATLP
jgi:hypothetical protein